MSKVCVLTGKRPITGNSVSHSNIKTKRRFLPNLQKKRFFLAEEDKWVTLKLSTEGIHYCKKQEKLTGKTGAEKIQSDFKESYCS